MAYHVDGDVILRKSDVGAVVRVETSQEILIGLSSSGVLDCDEAGDELKKIPYLFRRN
jgi:hypothetical protein